MIVVIDGSILKETCEFCGVLMSHPLSSMVFKESEYHELLLGFRYFGLPEVFMIFIRCWVIVDLLYELTAANIKKILTKTIAFVIDNTLFHV